MICTDSILCSVVERHNVNTVVKSLYRESIAGSCSGICILISRCDSSAVHLYMVEGIAADSVITRSVKLYHGLLVIVGISVAVV